MKHTRNQCPLPGRTFASNPLPFRKPLVRGTMVRWGPPRTCLIWRRSLAKTARRVKWWSRVGGIVGCCWRMLLLRSFLWCEVNSIDLDSLCADDMLFTMLVILPTIVSL